MTSTDSEELGERLLHGAGASRRFNSSTVFGWRPTAWNSSMTERKKVADIEGVRVDYDGSGGIDTKTNTPIQVKVNHYLVDEFVFDPENQDYHEDELEELAAEYDPGEVIDSEVFGGAYTRLKYEYEDGEARVRSFKDASSEADGRGDWTALDFLKVLPVADRAVEQVPEVEDVQSSTYVLGDILDEAEDIEINRA